MNTKIMAFLHTSKPLWVESCRRNGPSTQPKLTCSILDWDWNPKLLFTNNGSPPALLFWSPPPELCTYLLTDAASGTKHHRHFSTQMSTPMVCATHVTCYKLVHSHFFYVRIKEKVRLFYKKVDTNNKCKRK